MSGFDVSCPPMVMVSLFHISAPLSAAAHKLKSTVGESSKQYNMPSVVPMYILPSQTAGEQATFPPAVYTE
jgi:hypothetical protein